MNPRPTASSRRRFLKNAVGIVGSAAAVSLLPPSIQRALALPARHVTGTIADVQHIVILIQENRSFDHYFGTLRGVRGFGDRHPVPLASGKPVWHQSDGAREILPFRLDTQTTSALRTPATPHTFADAQAAWNQGRFGFWPQFKTAMAMGHYRREDIPFQFALADAFTLCDAHHCSVTSGTDPNRIAIWSGSNSDPALRARGVNCTAENAEVNNLRCLLQTGSALPEPGYRYQGSAFNWLSIPELLEKAGISWRIYQDPNDNWTGLMHGGLAFDSFRNAKPGEPMYEKGMTRRSIRQLAEDVKDGTLPRVSWILPSMLQSEHPSPSSSLQGAEFTSQVLDALTVNPDSWGRTVIFLGFDENDGLFDHVPPPAPPSVNPDGTLAGKATLDLRGEYFNDVDAKYQHAADPEKGTLRPWGLGPRVPLYVISPWSKGGWVNSQVFDHTSIGQFIEKRFGITIPAISHWHRVVCGDLTSVFEFATPNDTQFPDISRVRDSAPALAAAALRPKPVPPQSPEALFHEPGARRSRALPYELHVVARSTSNGAASGSKLTLIFRNTGRAGAVFHVYDRLHLDRIPRRYTVEAGKRLVDDWYLIADQGCYDLWVLAPNGFVRELRGTLREGATVPNVELQYHPRQLEVEIVVSGALALYDGLTVQANAYRGDGPWSLDVGRDGRALQRWSLAASQHWYDFTVKGREFERRFAGRMETGADGVTDPAA